MHMIRFRGASEQGDTIVEVLISVAIVSLVLAAGYAITNRNVSSLQDTQERTQAQQLVLRQAEALRVMASAGPITSISNGCVIQGPTGAPIFTDNSAEACNFKADGSGGNCTVEPCYLIRITENSGIYAITATWHSLHGQDSVIELDYGV